MRLLNGSRRRLGVVVTAIVVALGAGLFVAATSADTANYRTAKADTGDVSATATFDGTIAASNRRDLAFATEGTVKSVQVATGDKVTGGQKLGSLDTTALERAVTEAEADLAAAKATLDDVQDGQIDTVSQAAGSTDGANGASSIYLAFAADATADALADALAELAAQQEAVKAAQTDATEAIAAAKDALAAQRSACAAEDAEATEGEAPSTGLSPACSAALDAVQTAQDVVAEKQDALQAALSALGDTLTEAIEQLGEEETPTPTPTAPSTPNTGTAPPRSAGSAPSASGASGASGSSGRTATAADLASAQAGVDTAEAALTQAEADLKSATLTAPFAGTVMAVRVAKGDDVAASDVAFVVIGAGDATATLSVPVDDLAALKVGQRATVTAGSGTRVSATVTAIGLAPEATDTSSTTYQVTVTLDEELATPEGASVSVSITTQTSKDAVTVPASAVTRLDATTGTVLVVEDGHATPTRVTLGALGGTTIAVTDGLKAGQSVVLADLDEALPSADTQNPRIGGLGGFGGSGGPPTGARPQFVTR